MNVQPRGGVTLLPSELSTEKIHNLGSVHPLNADYLMCHRRKSDRQEFKDTEFRRGPTVAIVSASRSVQFSNFSSLTSY